MGWIIDSAINHTINISKLDPGSSYIKFPKELDHSEKRSINIQNTDENECFKWCLVRYLHPAHQNLGKLIKELKC